MAAHFLSLQKAAQVCGLLDLWEHLEDFQSPLQLSHFPYFHFTFFGQPFFGLN